eukprot:1685740-Rhodomonas_salina.2
MHCEQPMGFLDPAFARTGSPLPPAYTRVMQCLVYDTTTDGYGWGMTMLVALTGQNAMDTGRGVPEWAEPDLVDRCDDALFGGDVTRCLVSSPTGLRAPATTACFFWLGICGTDPGLSRPQTLRSSEHRRRSGV